MQYVNHPAFEGCIKYMPVHLLDFRPIPEHIARNVYTIGLCHYGHQEPYKTVEVARDNQFKAVEEGRRLLKPSLVENVRHVSQRSNEEYDIHHRKKPRFK